MRSLTPIFSLLNAFVFIFSFVLKDPDLLIYASILICVFMVLDKLGKGIVLREIIALFNSFIYLFMPLMGYLFFTKANTKAMLFLRYMPVSKEQYFDLALPAVTGFIFLLCLPLRGRISDEGKGVMDLIERAKKSLTGNRNVGLWMMGAGIAASFLSQTMPESLKYPIQLIYLSSFAGVMYLYFSGNAPIVNVYIALFVIFILLVSLRTGMFTIIAYMGMSVFSFLFLNRHVSMWKKMVYFTLGVFILVIIQSVKPEYRKKESIRGYETPVTRFTYLVIKRFDNIENLLTPDFMWPIYYRANQGYYVALVQNHVPKVKPHDNGKKLGIVFASAFVPRFLWPDKPKAGGLENMKYYAGFTLRGYTMNVGPLGEAYGSFGRMGAILYMLALGLFIRLAYRQVFAIGAKVPLVVLWLPLIFYEVSYAGENDTLQIVNSLLKSSIFVYILYRIVPSLFNMKPKPE
jgi:hypothetical protein